MDQTTEIDQLLNALTYGDHVVRHRAALALLSLGDAAVGPLRNQLRTGSPREQVEAARTLGELGNPSAIDDLLHALSAEDGRVAARAAHALGRLTSARCVPALLKALDHPQGDVRYESALALGKLRLPEVRPQLETRLTTETGLTSWGIPVVEGLRRALERIPRAR
ncbi:MAG: hypothetical protein NVS4B8_18180 [Herpetosiphon sp.]